MDTLFRCHLTKIAHIPHSPSNHNILYIFLSYIHNISYIYYLSTISCIYSFFYSTISCVLPRPLTPQPFILCILRYIDTISCGPETIWVYLVCYGITQYYILCRPNILWSVLNLYYILDSYRSCGNCYISPLRPSEYNAAYSAHNPCRPREARYLAF